MAYTINQTINFAAQPAEIYDILTDEALHAEITGEPADINPEVGGEFSSFGGWATGTFTELVENEKIVQTWHSSDWDTGELSTLTFVLEPQADGTTNLIMEHAGIPDSDEGIAGGWEEYYWQPMREWFAKLAIDGK